MKTANPFIDSIVETQANFLNNWMDSAKKMQSAFSNGNIAHEGQTIYKEWLDKQMNILNSMKDNSANLFSNNENNPQEFFKNWFNQQSGYAKQMTDFNQSIYNSYASFGKPTQDYMSNFGQMNTAYTNIYNAWMNTLNSSYDTMSKNMNGTFNKDVFTNFMQGNQTYAKMQEFFAPMADAMQKGKFNMDAFKNYFNAESYSNLTKQMFGNFYNGASVKEVYDNGMKQMQNFFTNQNGLSKEYFAQVQNMAKEFPNMFNGNATTLKDFYGQMNNVFGKTFEPLLKLATPGKEKDNVEATIALMDKMAEYSIKQAELQLHLQNTTQKSIEKVAKQYSEKYANGQALTQTPNVQEMYNEWVKTNEQLFAELFASDEFSKVKGEALNLSMDVKKHFEKQFEQVFENYPVVFKTEVEELQKTVYELKKQVKELQTKLSITTSDDDDKNAKNRKK
ncbi:MAG: hypothetical protein K0S32_2475 [Bacteroidetes bacterium]|jgi:polyhydroxyalkanoate synthesis regulator phasin|nr:hypothetical protein [Bacteroidota bacterium]